MAAAKASKKGIEQLAKETLGFEKLRPGQLQAIEAGQGEVQRYDANRVVVLFESVGYRTLDLKLVSEKGLLQAS